MPGATPRSCSSYRHYRKPRTQSLFKQKSERVSPLLQPSTPAFQVVQPKQKSLPEVMGPGIVWTPLCQPPLPYPPLPNASETSSLLSQRSQTCYWPQGLCTEVTGPRMLVFWIPPEASIWYALLEGLSLTTRRKHPPPPTALFLLLPCIVQLGSLSTLT